MITSKRLPSYSQVAGLLMSFFCLALLVKNSEAAIEYMHTGMKLCVEVVIPSLFPFMVISGLLVRIGIGSKLGKYMSHASSLILGIGSEAGCAVILGLLCGSPVGAQMTASLYESRKITKKEAERLLIISSAPSSAFIINAVGISLYSSKTIGLIFYSVTLSSVIIFGVLLKILFGNTESGGQQLSARPTMDISIFTNSITSAAISMLYVCAYVVFFSVLTGCIGISISKLNISHMFLPFVYGLLEISGGVGAAAVIDNRLLSICLTAFILGWSGLSVHLQIMSFCSGKNLKFYKYIASRFLIGLLNSAILFVIYKLFPSLFAPASSNISTPTISLSGSNYIAFTAIFLCLSFILYFGKKPQLR